MKRRGFIGLLLGIFLLPLRGLAEAICNPHLARLLGRHRKLAQVRGGGRVTSRRYFVQWFGHSSFLIHSANGVRIVTDPNFNVTPGIKADAVTVSNDHYTHNNIGAVGGDPLILRGITLEQTWNPISTRVKDILIVNLPSQRGFEWSQVANSIFIYQMGSLCVAHLGNIGHLLTLEQRRLMRKVDVMMIPIDARLNLDFADLVRVIEQVNPPVVIPMHYDDVVQAEIFTEFIGTRYPVRHMNVSQLQLSRATLPRSTEIVVLAHPSPVYPFSDPWSSPDTDTES